jgi:hypothetical protein
MLLLLLTLPSFPQEASKIHDRELQRQRCKKYNAASSPVRSEGKNVFFYFEKRTSLYSTTPAM